MEEREMGKNSFFATLSKPENKELKEFLKIYIIFGTIVISMIGITSWLLFTNKIKHFFDIWFVIFNIMVLFCIILYIILIPRTYRFLVKFLIPKFFKDLNKELNFENSLVKFLAPKILKDLSKELNSEDLKKELIKELIKELEKDNKKKIT